jgi:mRNA-degrading endonuclease toxin of MazEF toxin-antitoxin module
MVRLQQGSIVWVRVGDQAGRNPKCRPAVILTPTNEISPGEQLVAVAVTSTFSKPLPQNQIELPWQHGGHPVTGLKKRCVAVCDWLIEVDQSAIEAIGGVAPPLVLTAILAQIPPDAGAQPRP